MNEQRILILVESPNKCATIKSLLKGTQYSNAIIMASVGHILEIADGGKYCNCGIDPTNNFKANYKISKDKQEVVQKLKEQVAIADIIYICSDPDREGESIAWSLLEFLNISEDKYKRATFHEITKKAILNALDNATKIDYNLVDSADARRKIDKILGYRLSPIGRKYIQARSIGRCQSVGLKILVEREKEIQSFIPEEYWELYLHFTKENNEYKAKYINNKNEKLNKINVDEIIKNCNDNYKINNIITKEKQNNTKPPFTTSTFQQEVSNKLNISVKDAMSIAQKLFEGININGEHKALITYIRTDSDDMSEDFQLELKDYIKNNYGEQYLGKLKQGKKVDNAQQGHECLRCIDLEMTPDKLSNLISDKYLLKVYDIIYRRTIASMMKPEIISETTYEIINNNNLFNLISREQLFDGYKKVYIFKDDDKDDISKITFEKDEILQNCNLEPIQNFTKPKPRYKEATFIKELENSGIGRPSTFASILATILDNSRGYCSIQDNQLIPTEKGIKLIEFLDKNFPNIININYTSEMEKKLDEIANGKKDEILILNSFYTNLEENIKQVQNNLNSIEKQYIVNENIKCPNCGSVMYLRLGKFGEFYGCSNYPKCKGIVNILKNENKN